MSEREEELAGVLRAVSMLLIVVKAKERERFAFWSPDNSAALHSTHALVQAILLMEARP